VDATTEMLVEVAISRPPAARQPSLPNGLARLLLSSWLAPPPPAWVYVIAVTCPMPSLRCELAVNTTPHALHPLFRVLSIAHWCMCGSAPERGR